MSKLPMGLVFLFGVLVGVLLNAIPILIKAGILGGS